MIGAVNSVRDGTPSSVADLSSSVQSSPASAARRERCPVAANVLDEAAVLTQTSPPAAAPRAQTQPRRRRGRSPRRRSPRSGRPTVPLPVDLRVGHHSRFHFQRSPSARYEHPSFVAEFGASSPPVARGPAVRRSRRPAHVPVRITPRRRSSGRRRDSPEASPVAIAPRSTHVPAHIAAPKSVPGGRSAADAVRVRPRPGNCCSRRADRGRRRRHVPGSTAAPAEGGQRNRPEARQWHPRPP